MSRSVEAGEVKIGDVTFQNYTCFVGDDPEKKIPGEKCDYRVPKTAEDFKKFVLGADLNALTDIWDEYGYGHGLKARAAARPAGEGVTLPVLATKKYGRLDYFTGKFGKGLDEKASEGEVKWSGTPLALETRIKRLNALFAMAAANEEQPPRAALVAKEQLVTAKLVTESNGVLKAAAK